MLNRLLSSLLLVLLGAGILVAWVPGGFLWYLAECAVFGLMLAWLAGWSAGKLELRWSWRFIPLLAIVALGCLQLWRGWTVYAFDTAQDTLRWAVYAVLFFLAGSTLVHLAELLIRPYLVSAASSIHPLLVLISFMGGGMVAGMAGFFLAPALVGVIVGTYQVMAEEAELRRRSGLCSEPEEDGLGEEPGDASRVEGIDNAAKDDAAKIQQG